jgi:hypothetical protein
MNIDDIALITCRNEYKISLFARVQVFFALLRRTNNYRCSFHSPARIVLLPPVFSHLPAKAKVADGL